MLRSCFCMVLPAAFTINMNIGIAFSRTMERFGLKSKDVEKGAKVSHGVISRFKGGGPINTDSLEKLLDILDDEAFQYFQNELASARKLRLVLQEPTDLSTLVGHLTEQELSQLLYEIASRLRVESTKDKLADDDA